MKKYFIVFFISIALFSFSTLVNEKIKEADEAFIGKKYPEALKIYQDVLKEIDASTLTASDLLLYNEIKESAEDLKIIIDFNPILLLFKTAVEHETEQKWAAVRDDYLQIRYSFIKNNIKKLKYQEQFLDGSLEEFLLQKKIELMKKRESNAKETLKKEESKKEEVKTEEPKTPLKEEMPLLEIIEAKIYLSENNLINGILSDTKSPFLAANNAASLEIINFNLKVRTAKLPKEIQYNDFIQKDKEKIKNALLIEGKIDKLIQEMEGYQKSFKHAKYLENFQKAMDILQKLSQTYIGLIFIIQEIQDQMEEAKKQGLEALFKKIDKAHQLYANKQYKESLSLYQSVLEMVDEKTITDPSDKIIFEDIHQSIEELLLLTKIEGVFLPLKNATASERSKNYPSARDFYLKARDNLLKNQVKEVPYFNEIINNTLENYLLEKRRRSMDKLTFAYLDRVKKDRKRKKSIVFSSFKKDSSVEFDLEILLKQTIDNIMTRNMKFIIKDKTYKGSYEDNIKQGLQDNIDFMIAGSYKRSRASAILLNFYIVDPALNKRLIEITIQAPMDFQFFGIVESLVGETEKNLKDYTRLEDFAAIKYSKKDQGAVVTEKESIGGNLEKKNLSEYIDNKIVSLEKQTLDDIGKDLYKDNTNLLSIYNVQAVEIIAFNNLEFPQKFSYEAYILKDKEKIKSKMIATQQLDNVFKSMQRNKKEGFYEEYYNDYQKAKISIAGLNKTFPGLKPIIEELEAKFDSDKNAMDNKLGNTKNVKFKNRQNIYAGFNLFLEREYASETSSLDSNNKVGPTAGLLVLFNKAWLDSFLFYHFKLAYIFGRNTDISYNGEKYGTLENNSSLDLTAGLDYFYPITVFLDIGATGGFGLNMSFLSFKNDADDTGEKLYFGYKGYAGLLVESRYYFPIRFEFFYEFGKTECLSHNGFGFSLLLRVFSF